MTAQEYWKFYRNEYEWAVGMRVNNHIIIRGGSSIPENVFDEANKFAADFAQKRLDHVTFMAKIVDKPGRELCYGEVSA